MRQYKLTSKMLLLGIAIALASCDRETIVNAANTPQEITTYVAKHFPSNRILQVTKDVDGLTKTYDVVLNGNISLEFNRQKEIIDIDADTKLPDSVIPSKIRDYVNSNFPDNFITDWDLESRLQQVGLNNDLDIEFTLNGDFLRIDN